MGGGKHVKYEVWRRKRTRRRRKRRRRREGEGRKVTRTQEYSKREPNHRRVGKKNIRRFFNL